MRGREIMRRRILTVFMGVAVLVVAGGVTEAAINHRQGNPGGALTSVSEKKETGSPVSPSTVASPLGTVSNLPASSQLHEPLVAGSVEKVTQVLNFAHQRQMELHYPGAGYVKPHFSDMHLSPGDYVKV